MRPPIVSLRLSVTLRRRTWIALVVTGHMACIMGAVGGCAKGRGAGQANEALARGEHEKAHVVNVDPRRIQAANMSFADRYVAAMADEYDRAKLAAKTPQAAIMAQRLKILAGVGAMGNAVDPNPIVGLMDMGVMVTLSHQIAQDEWVGEMFGQDRADALVAMLEVYEADIWRIAGSYLTTAQIEELHQIAARWRNEHPEQRYLASARLADFPESRSKNGGAGVGGAAQQIAGSVFGLVTLDPFHGLDPAVKEVAETRVMAERLFFYLRHMPIMMTWQADSLFDQMLAEPQIVKMFEDTTTVAGSTTRFSDATSRFSDASTALSKTVENFRLQLPDQQAKLVAELDGLVARQREGALQQATTQVSAQREATLQQLGTTVTAQQDLMTRNLQTVSDQSIDRLYGRARSLVLITVGSILIAFILYRLFASTRPQRRPA